MATVQVARTMSPVDEVLPPPAKVAFDRLLSGIFLVITVPVSLVIAAAIAVENAVCPSHRGGLFHSELRVSAGRRSALQFHILTPLQRTGNQGRSDAQAC